MHLESNLENINAAQTPLMVSQIEVPVLHKKHMPIGTILNKFFFHNSAKTW